MTERCEFGCWRDCPVDCPWEQGWEQDRRVTCRVCGSLIKLKHDGKLRKHPAPVAEEARENWYRTRGHDPATRREWANP